MLTAMYPQSQYGAMMRRKRQTYTIIQRQETIILQDIGKGTQHRRGCVGCTCLKSDLDYTVSAWISALLSMGSGDLPKSKGCVAAAAQQAEDPPNQNG